MKHRYGDRLYNIEQAFGIMIDNFYPPTLYLWNMTDNSWQMLNKIKMPCYFQNIWNKIEIYNLFLASNPKKNQVNL